MKHLKPFKIFESDWWDSDPNAPWNQEDPPDPTRRIDWVDEKDGEKKLEFKVEKFVKDYLFLKRLSDGAYFVCYLDSLSFEEDFDDYRYSYYQDGDYFSIEDDEYSVLAWIHDHPESVSQTGTVEEYENGEKCVFKLSEELRKYLVDELGDIAASKYVKDPAPYIDGVKWLLGLSGFPSDILGI
jgi:hypothetical protein